MVSRLAPLLLAFACAAAVGCGDGEAEAVDAKSSRLHGTWRDGSGVDRPAILDVVQEGSSIELTLALDKHSCLAKTTVKTKITLAGVKADTTIGGMRIAIDSGPRLDDIAGTFREVSDGTCERGWFNVYR